MAERLESAFVVPSNFKIYEVPTVPPGATIAAAAPRLAPPTLGALAGLAGTFTGNGFNTIFRPQNPATPTPLPIPVPTSDFRQRPRTQPDFGNPFVLSGSGIRSESGFAPGGHLSERRALCSGD
jgi:hypothetical protein